MNWRRALHHLLALGAAVALSGCENLYWPNSENVSDEVHRERLVGCWRRDGYEHHLSHDSFSPYRDELQFEDDGTFRYARIWPDFPLEQQRTFVGTWTVSDGNLVQYWRKRSGRKYRTSVLQLVETRQRDIVLQDDSDTVHSFRRAPRRDDD